MISLTFFGEKKLPNISKTCSNHEIQNQILNNNVKDIHRD